MTLPLATLSSYWKLEITLNPASSRSFCASVSLIPLTSGTCFLLFTSPELNNNFYSCIFLYLFTGFRSLFETSPALYFLDSVLLIGFIPRSFFFSAAFACSSVIPRISGTVTFPDASASSSVDKVSVRIQQGMFQIFDQGFCTCLHICGPHSSVYILK